MEKYKEEERKYDFLIYLSDEERFVPMRVKVSAGLLTGPLTYAAAFILDGQRVRGIGHQEIVRKRYYTTHIPKGWHQNVIDPNLAGEDKNQNRHLEMPITNSPKTDSPKKENGIAKGREYTRRKKELQK